MDVALGWNGVVRAERYTPLIVSLENSGRKAACTVKVDVISGSQVRGTYNVLTLAQDVTLSARSRKRLFFVFPMPAIYRPLRVRVLSADKELLSQSLELGEALMSSGRLVVTVSSELSMDFLASLMQDVRVVYPHVENLPENWAGYDGVDTVVFHDSAFQSLRASQVSALKQWVFSGGTLIVSGGPSALQLDSAGIDSLLPVKVTGLALYTRLPSLSRLSGGAAPPSGNTILAESRLAGNSTALIAEGNVPLVAERRIGRGVVRFLAFDCAQAPMNGWAGNASMWHTLVSGSGLERTAQPVTEPVDDPWLKTVLAAPSFFFPSVLILSAFMAALILGVLVIINLKVTGKMKAGTRALVLVFFAAAASTASWILFERTFFPREAFVLEASTVHAASYDGMARVSARVGLFSTGGGTYDLTVPEKTALVTEITSARAGQARTDFEELISDQVALRGVHLDPYGSRLFLVEGVVDMPVTAAVSRGSDSCTVKVQNMSKFALRQCFVSIDGKLYPIGDVAPGARLEEELDLGSSKAEAAVVDPRRMPFWQQAKSGFKGEVPQLFGWLDRPLIPLKGSAGIGTESTESVHLLVVDAG